MQVFGTAVVVFQIVGVLPDVVAEDGTQALRDGIVLIRRAENLHFAFRVSCQPDPSAAELAYTGGVEFFLKSFEVAESFLDGFGYGAVGIASTFRFHDVPEHGVIDVASAVIADGSSDVFGDGVQVADQIFGTFCVELRMFVQGGVQVLDVSGVMHVVMQMHRLFINGGFQGRVVVRQGGELMRHFLFPPKR